MVLVQDDHVIEQLSPCAPNPSLRDPVLPRAPECRSLRLDAKILNRFANLIREDRIVIEDEKSRSRVVGKGLAKLLNDPG